MPTTLELCEKYFGTRDIYKLMSLQKDATKKDVKKAYYRLSLQVHPDRVAESEKEEATEKFKALAKIHSVLIDEEKKALYDEQNIIDDTIDDSGCDWSELWHQFFNFDTTCIGMQNYIGSEAEQRDIRNAYVNGQGCIKFIINSVPFMRVEDEPRLIEQVQGWIAEGLVPKYKEFPNKTYKKRKHNNNNKPKAKRCKNQ